MKELLLEFLGTILNEAGKKGKASQLRPGESSDYPGYFHRGRGYYSQSAGGPITHKTDDGKLKALSPEEKKQKNAGKQPEEPKATARTTPPTRPVKEPAAEPGKQSILTQPKGKSVELKTAYRELYGRNGDGELLLNSPDAQKVLDDGFIAGKGAPPGSAGSNFNENISDEAALILSRYPDMDEATLARLLFERVKDTTLANQQSDTSVQGTKAYAPQGTGKRPARIAIPDDITDEQQKFIWKCCVISARSGRQKYIRALRGVQAAQEKGFGKVEEIKTFGGAAGDLQRAKETVASANKCYVYDQELGLIEVPKEILVEWISQSGGGKNAADTVVMTIDANGNLIYDGWSDKKTLADIQGNSTLNEEYTAMADAVLELADAGGISESDEKEAMSILLSAQQFSDDLEERYSDTSAQLASHYLDEFSKTGGIPEERMNLYLDIINHPDVKVRRGLNLDGHFASFTQKVENAISSSGGKAIDKKIRQLYQEAQKRKLKGPQIQWYILNRLAEEGLLTGDERKILERISGFIVEAKQAADSDEPLTPGSARQRTVGPFTDRVSEMGDVSRLDIKNNLVELRRDTVEFQSQQLQALNKISITNSHGDRVRLGDHLEARNVIALLHLDKIDQPSAETGTPEFFDQVLVRSTQLMMEGIPVTPQILRECLQVNSSREFEKNFEVIRDDKDPNTVFIYALRGKNRVLVARKQYRSKSGATGKTGTVITWEKDMQNCFDEKNSKG